MAPFFANQSCDPFTAQSQTCEYGPHVRYAVDARSVSDVKAAIRFAKATNIRLVIRNTGHDYLGRSTGAGALAIWTHNMKDITFSRWNDNWYQGSVMRVGAGVQGFEVVEAAAARGLVVVTGECPTVGLAGGYVQGGGHSALSTNFGLAADNVLEYEVVTASGNHIVASRTKNADLYYALSGGGGGNWGVVTGMTVKAHRPTIGTTSGATLAFFTGSNSEDLFFNAIDAFHEELPDMVDAGTMVVYYFGSAFFQISPITALDKTQAEVADILAPYLARLDNMGVVYSVSFSEFPSYLEHYDNYFGPLPVGNIQVGIAQYGGRLIPRSVIGNLSDTARFVASQGVTWIGVGLDVSQFEDSQTAVLPAWRDTIVHATLTTPWDFQAPWDDMIALQDLMTDVVMPVVEAATPGSGAYMNEADFQQPNFQEVFFGSNYNKLLRLKNRWDPEGLFYVRNAVGSEEWEVANDGRMCRVD